MISVIIPTLDDEGHLAATLGSLVAATVDGLVREVIVADGGSNDRTLEVADGAGTEIVTAKPGRGAQLRAGVARARFPWLLFLNADTVLDPGWERDAAHHVERVESGRRPPAAAAFRFALDDGGAWPRTLEALASVRSGLFKLPYGNQGLLISRRLYDEIGGFGTLPLMEDVDLVRRLGRRRISILNARAVTSAERFRRASSLSQIARSQACLGLYLIGVPVGTIAALFGRPLEPI
jgi:rSAM/selenodomain-associated transferase 2